MTRTHRKKNAIGEGVDVWNSIVALPQAARPGMRNWGDLTFVGIDRETLGPVREGSYANYSSIQTLARTMVGAQTLLEDRVLERVYFFRSQHAGLSADFRLRPHLLESPKQKWGSYKLLIRGSDLVKAFQVDLLDQGPWKKFDLATSNGSRCSVGRLKQCLTPPKSPSRRELQARVLFRTPPLSKPQATRGERWI